MSSRGSKTNEISDLLLLLRTASDNPSHKVSGRAPRHHCVGILGHATLPTLNVDADPMASSVCGWGKRPGASGVPRCRLLPMLLSVGGTGQGKPRHRHRSSQRFSALGCHLPGHEGAEVRRALTTTVRAGLEEGVQPMVGIEPPQQDSLDHTKQHRCQVGAPHTASTVIVLAADDRVAQDALRGVIVHGHFGALDKHREPVPVVTQAAQPFCLPRCRSLS